MCQDRRADAQFVAVLVNALHGAREGGVRGLIDAVVDSNEDAATLAAWTCFLHAQPEGYKIMRGMSDRDRAGEHGRTGYCNHSRELMLRRFAKSMHTIIDSQ